MHDYFVGKRLLIYTNSGNEYVGVLKQVVWTPPHKYLLVELDQSTEPFDEGDPVYLETKSIESFAVFPD
ncbi:hypothetical protein [Vallitalea okinawensis]|uniref:hypothetical protein n=1 Tax=Vallitalea okinawensis TaxID=2078660 RepID=UPI000CFCA6C5|nr:hypothetical protein [Vallitalea okinawensis]